MKTNKKRLLVSQCWDNKSIYKISCQVFYFNIEIPKLSSCYNKEHPVKFQAQVWLRDQAPRRHCATMRTTDRDGSASHMPWPSCTSLRLGG